MYSKTLCTVLYITSRNTERCSRTIFPIGQQTLTDVRTHNTQKASNILYREPGILVGMATGYGAGRPGNRILVGGGIFRTCPYWT